MKPQAVVFDIGNVLIGWDPEGYYDRRIGEAARRRLFAEADLAAMNLSIDAGAPFRATIMDCAARHPAWAEEIRWWFNHWIDLASPRIDGSIALLRALRRRGTPVFALTNFGVDSFAYAQTQYDFLNEFDRTYVSGRMNAIKPDPRIYEMVEQDSAIAPAGLIFTDDRDDNIASAHARGWKTHHFVTWQGWARRLVDEQLLTQEEAGL